jgi:hypothetical protein
LIAAEDVAACHLRLALAWEAHPHAEPEALYEHYRAAGRRAAAAEQAVIAGDRAAGALAFDRAAALYQAAIELGEGPAPPALRLRLAEALASGGRGALAAEIFLSLAGPDRLDHRRRAAELLLGTGHLDRGQAVLAEVLAEVGDRMPATPRRALASLVWRRARLRVRGLGWRERAPGAVPPRDLARLEVHGAVSIGLGMIDTVRGADFQARALLGALRAGEPRHVARALAFEAIYQGTQSSRRAPRALQLVDAARAIAERLADPYLLAVAGGARGVVDLYRGNFRAAAEALAGAETVLRDSAGGAALELNNLRVFRYLALRYLGAYRELAPLFHEHVRDAVRRGDRFAEATMSRAFNVVWLVEDDPDGAAAALERRPWTPPAGAYHVQDYYELLARAELALYRAEAPVARAALAPALAAFSRSLLLRIEMMRAAGAWLRGRLAVATGDGRAADAEIAALTRERAPYVDIWTDLLRAARAPADRAVALLRCVAARSEAQDRRFYVAVARRREGQVAGDAALVAQADAWMLAEGIRDPARMCDVVAPGF